MDSDRRSDHSCFQSITATPEEIVFSWSFEQLVFALFEPKAKDFSEYVTFHEYGRSLRAELTEQLEVSKILFAPPLAALQSLSATLCLYDHHWAYYNQLVMSYACFFQDEAKFFEYIEQQIFYAGARNALNPNTLPAISALINLCALNFDFSTHLSLLKVFSQQESELPCFASALIGALSSQMLKKRLPEIGPWIDTFSRLRIKEQCRKYQPHLRIECPPGFDVNPPIDLKSLVISQKIAESVGNQYEPFSATYALMLSIEKELQAHGLYPTYEFYLVGTLHGLGLYPNWIVAWTTFAQLPIGIAQYLQILHNPATT
ncbi:MAG: hypothetical protein FJ161_03945 [Gammaproteobacteria bacterium]|nr:hypothetical protein [Gammaproteobacteria bacterium]